jgi:hypothetical protein
MPVKRKRNQKGAGFMDALKSANNWLKKTKVISKVAGTLNSVGVPYANTIGGVAKKLGYGKRGKGKKSVIKV